MSPLDDRAVRWRYLTLIGLRWLPTGLMIPLIALVPLSRGLSLTQIGVVFAVVGIVVLVLELPTGGLSDSLGRRPVLIAASTLAILSLAIFTVADTFPLFVVAMVIQGVYRALDSGPLEAWFVDHTLHADPEASIERGLGHGSTVLGVAIAGGALLSGALVALHPIPSLDPLTLPLLVALVFLVVNLVAIVTLLVEPPRARHPGAIAESVRAVPGVVAEGLALLRSSRVLLALVAVEAFWGFSMVTFEQFFPIRLSGLVGGEDAAAAIMGPVGSAAWLAAAGGAAGAVVLSRRLGVARSAAVLRIAQGIAVLFIGVLTGVAGVVAAYLACYVAHGASNPLHTTLLHRQVDSAHRTTVLSMNSMVGMPAGALGGMVLAALADATSLPLAIIVGAVICATAAPLYLPAWRAEQERGKGAIDPDAEVLAAQTRDVSAHAQSGPDVRDDDRDRSRLEVQRFADAQLFLDETGPFLAEREAEHNLLFGIAATLIVDPSRWRDRPYLAAITREGDVVAAALMTPPWNVVLSTTEDPEAIPALIHDLDRSRFSVPGVTASVDVARRFSEVWASRHGTAARRTMAERIYRADRITPPSDVSGAMRLGSIDDRDLLIEWMGGFLEEALHGESIAQAETMVQADLESGSRTYYIWEVDGRPVSTAGVTGPTPNGIRVGPVYTPPDVRRRGYGSAVTAAASQAQLDAGRRFVFLFTDLANPTSNKIYQAIGYEPVIDVDQWSFEPAGAPSAADEP